MDRRRATTPLAEDLMRDRTAGSVFTAPYPVAGGQLGDLYSCTPREHRFPREINMGENQDLYFVAQLAFDALADAGMRLSPNSPVRGSLYLGYAPALSPTTVHWLQHTFFLDQTMELLSRFFPSAPPSSLDNVRRRLSESLPAPSQEAFVAASGHCVASSIAASCGFNSPAVAIDSGVASFFDACRMAADDLRSGRVDVALAGAVMPPLSRAFLEGVSAQARFSTHGELTPFDAASSGTIPGEGGALFVMKRRSDALKSRDRIYALYRHSASSGTIGDTPPLVTLCNESETPLKSIRFIEADGSGIPEADTAELATISSLWGSHSTGGALVGVGSCKGNFGHAFRAAAAAGAVKAALALKMRVLMPQVGVMHRLDAFAGVSSSVYILDEARPWVTRDASTPRRAAILASEFSGRQSAMLLEEEPEDRS